MRDRHYLVLLICLMVLTLGFLDEIETTTERDHACDMYQVWIDTDGDAGWPDYKGQCEHLTMSDN